METITMDPNGDVIFVVTEVKATQSTDGQHHSSTKGATAENKVGFLVSSKVLGLASDVFGALLGPRFREGHALAQAATASQAAVELPLPDDDPVSDVEVKQ
jgi:hypothetical protein